MQQSSQHKGLISLTMAQHLQRLTMTPAATGGTPLQPRRQCNKNSCRHRLSIHFEAFCADFPRDLPSSLQADGDKHRWESLHPAGTFTYPCVEATIRSTHLFHVTLQVDCQQLVQGAVDRVALSSSSEGFHCFCLCNKCW